MTDLHFPPPGDWPQRTPQELGFDTEDLARACNYAASSEIDWPTDVSAMVAADDPPPYNEIIGPTKPRGEASGVVVKDGFLAASWGTPTRVDMTFSATKSYLSTCVGLAVDRGLIASVDDPVVDSVPGDWFTSAHNRQITWRHLLQQTSEWSGTLFGIPDSVDHNRSVAQPKADAVEGRASTLAPARHFLGVQRCTRQRARTSGAPCLAGNTSRRVADGKSWTPSARRRPGSGMHTAMPW